jgi:2-polyprenyl-3-methyl-5-hydroxy-6-metoxy-1,4-benzoquinol methylase
MNDIYTEQYYKTLNYSDYLSRLDKYVKTANEISDLLNKMGLDKNKFKKPILDFGCSTGFLVHGFQKNGYEHTFGYDISDWAVSYGTNELGIKNLSTSPGTITAHNYFMTCFLDVLEHMRLKEIEKLLKNLKSLFILVRIPVADVNGHYILETARKDPTHKIAWIKHHWHDLFINCNYVPVCKLNLNLIYDSPGVFCALYKKRNDFPYDMDILSY